MFFKYLWMIESKDFDSSNQDTVTYLFSSIEKYEVLKPNWVLMRRFLAKKCSLSCLYISFSKTLESAPVIEIGL